MKIGDRIERYDGPLSDLILRPIRLTHELAQGRKITLELTFDLGFVLKVDGQEFDGMLAKPMGGLAPDLIDDILESAVAEPQCWRVDSEDSGKLEVEDAKGEKADQKTLGEQGRVDNL